MKLDTRNWLEYTVDDLFYIDNGKGITAEEISSYPGHFEAIQSGEENNGVLGLIDYDYCVQQKYTLSDEPCLTVARSGSAGFVSFHKNGCVVGDSAKILKLKDSVHCNEHVYLFLRAVLSAIRYKYSYGRKVTIEKYAQETLRLPSLSQGRPDWQFMEDYIKSLRHKPITTRNQSMNITLGCSKWEEFMIPSLFEVMPGIYHYSDEYENGLTPYVSASNTNNAVCAYINLEPDFEGNAITIGKIGATSYYQPVPFCATSDVNVLIPKFAMTAEIGLFIVGVINYSENYKWFYGRQCRVGDTKGIVIKLPIKFDPDGSPSVDNSLGYHSKGYVPDWQFMEDYIKHLPYGDRI